MQEKEADGELCAWELSEGPLPPHVKRDAKVFNEGWDEEPKAGRGNPQDADDIPGSNSQEIKPWVWCALQGGTISDPSWHHPPPLAPHYPAVVFETGQSDGAED